MSFDDSIRQGGWEAFSYCISKKVLFLGCWLRLAVLVCFYGDQRSSTTVVLGLQNDVNLESIGAMLVEKRRNKYHGLRPPP